MLKSLKIRLNDFMGEDFVELKENFLEIVGDLFAGEVFITEDMNFYEVCEQVDENNNISVEKFKRKFNIYDNKKHFIVYVDCASNNIIEKIEVFKY